jgi:hypothetical protein
MSKVPQRRAFDLNLTMTWNDLQQVRSRVTRMWACAESDKDFEILENLDKALEMISDRIQKH